MKIINPYNFKSGNSHLIISIPHCGQYLGHARDQMTEAGLSLIDTDFHTDKLYDLDIDCSVISANYSRYLIDLNRNGDLTAPIRKSVSELVPSKTAYGYDIYYDYPTTEDIQFRIEHYWKPYHNKIQQTIEEVLDKHGKVILIEGHSIYSNIPKYGKLPNIMIGTCGGLTADPILANKLLDIGLDNGFETILDERFKGGYITRTYGNPDRNIHAIQLEITWESYLDETNPYDYDPDKARNLKDNFILPVLECCLR